MDQARNLRKQWNQPRPVPPQPLPRPYYKFFVFFLIHINIVWSPTFMSTGMISLYFWPLLAWFYRSSQKSEEGMEPTKTNPTNTPTVLQSLYVLPNTYYYSMKSNFYVYRYDIYLFLAITGLIMWIKPENGGSNGINQDQYHPNQHMDGTTKFICSSEYILLQYEVQLLCLPA